MPEKGRLRSGQAFGAILETLGRLSPDGCVDDAYGEMGPVKGGVFSVRVTHGEVWLLIRRSLQGETDGGHGSAERLPPAKAGALVR